MSSAAFYTELRPGRARLVPVRSVHYQLREWGDASLVTSGRCWC
jgi:hypothetical protein